MPFHAGNRLGKGGSRPGSGPKPDALKQELHDLIREAVPSDKQLEILRIFADRAHSGDVRAAAFIFDRLYGRPVQHLEIEGDQADVPTMDLSRLTAEELAELERLMRKAANTEAADAGPSPRGAIAP